MLAAIADFFESRLKLNNDDSPTATTDKLHLTCAALLLELCQADQSIDEQEEHKLRGILKRVFALDEEALATLWQLAHEETRDATSLYQFTSLINERYGHDEKIQLLGYMWEVAYADGQLDRYEEHLIRKVADLLYLGHSDFIRTKLAARPQPLP